MTTDNAPCLQSRPVADLDGNAHYGDGSGHIFRLCELLLLFRHDVPDA